jgi:hypothetical protein
MPPPLQESRLSDFLRGFLILLIVPLAGCTLGANKQTALPPPPKPAAVQPPAPEAPLSIAQTAVTLPSPQPVNPDSIPKVQVAAQEPSAPEKPETPPPARAARRTAPPATKQEPEAEPEPPSTPVVQEPAPPIQPILSADDQNRIRASIDTRKKEIAETLRRANRRLSTHDKTLVERIRSFLAQCDEAEKRGDLSQADTLSERAAVLAKELQVE